MGVTIPEYLDPNIDPSYEFKNRMRSLGMMPYDFSYFPQIVEPPVEAPPKMPAVNYDI